MGTARGLEVTASIEDANTKITEVFLAFEEAATAWCFPVIGPFADRSRPGRSHNMDIRRVVAEMEAAYRRLFAFVGLPHLMTTKTTSEVVIPKLQEKLQAQWRGKETKDACIKALDTFSADTITFVESLKSVAERPRC